VVYDHEKLLSKLYKENLNLSATMGAKLQIENEKRLVQMKSEEMRILIGNVAHDLKSPLQSFTSELETLLSLFHHCYLIRKAGQTQLFRIQMH